MDATPEPASHRGCRAIAAGLATIDAGAEVPARAWIDLEKGGTLTTKDRRSGREVSFAGPARIMPCRDGAEEAWMLRGTVTGNPGSGEAPGQEEWVVTPFGVVRYASAAGTIAAEDKLHVSLVSGTAFVWTPGGTTKASDGPVHDVERWTRIDMGGGLVVTATRKLDARLATTGCTTAAQAAADLAQAVTAPDANVGDLAARHVVLRREARAACALAALRVATLADEGEKKALAALVDSADQNWHSSHLGEAKAR
jgi:hypothetical protein